MIPEKRGVLGWEPGDARHISVLNRLVGFSWNDAGQRVVRCEPDPRRAELIVETMGVANGKAVNAPGAKPDDHFDNRVVEDQSKATAFRSRAMRLGYVAQDLPMLQLASRKLISHVSYIPQARRRELRAVLWPSATSKREAVP